MSALSSMQNPRIKSLLALAKPRERNERKVFALEGAREIARALGCGYQAEAVYWCAAILSAEARGVLASLPSEVQRTEVAASVFAKLAVREGSDGVIVVLQQRRTELGQLSLPQAPLLLAVERLEKPGNLGALLRSADGAGAHAVALLDQTVDLYNPLVLRSSVGTAFSVPVVTATSAELREFCRSRGIQVVAAALTEKSCDYTDVAYSKPTAVLLGTEAHGLSAYWLEQADAFVKIPMRGVADSLNVSVAGAILLYEAVRQRAAETVTGPNL